ncbi:hypothetical protein AB8A21_05180 [Streptomyces sp. BF23-18]|uniref:hypothetical protein n=1 Tax=Streptomyces sp. BF23-18 TaxID=3240282 RepID=UPI0034E5ECF7
MSPAIMPTPKPPRFVVAIEVSEAMAVTTETNIRWSGLKREKTPPAISEGLRRPSSASPRPLCLHNG